MQWGIYWRVFGRVRSFVAFRGAGCLVGGVLARLGTSISDEDSFALPDTARPDDEDAGQPFSLPMQTLRERSLSMGYYDRCVSLACLLLPLPDPSDHPVFVVGTRDECTCSLSLSLFQSLSLLCSPTDRLPFN